MKSIVLAITIILGTFAQTQLAHAAKLETAVLAGGCFWCIEADFESVPGVRSVVSGFTGGTTPNPTYKKVTKGGTGHYEAVQIRYDPDKITYEQILFMFFRSIDPTDAGGQFCDRGNSYRTAVFTSNPEEQALATAAVAQARADLGQNIVTKLLPGARFYKAEAYHQNYYKGSKIIVTRRGPKSKAKAYKFYRSACGRDDRVRSLWGNAAPFVN